MELFSAYAYSIVKVHEYQVEDGRVRLVRIRDPGNQKWLNMFKDSSKVWKDELNLYVGSKPSDTNTILISIEDYLCYFRTTLICQANPSLNSSSLKCKHNFGDSTLIRISVSESENISFTFSQFNQKFVGRSENKEPAFMRIILARELDSNEEEAKNFPYEFIEGKAGYEEVMNMNYDCKPGDYFAFIEIQGKLKKQNNFVFRTFSREVPLVEEVKGTEAKDFLQNALKSFARKSDQKKTYADKGEPDIFRCLYIDEDKTRYGYLYYENNSKDSTIKEEVFFEQLKGVIVQGHHGKKSVHVEVGPGENELIVLDQINKEYIMKCEYYTSIHKSTESLKDLVKEKGEKKQITFDGKAQDVFYYVYDDGDGYVWMFENDSKDTIFEGTFIYTLNNLRITDHKDKDSNEWKVKLQPGEISYMRMDAIDITNSWGYKCKCSFH
jgi:hypothetical protein